MIIMSVALDNIYSFKNFKINFSYPKKIKNSNIEYEYLKDRENFRFKKLNILMGANASGKTTLGLALMSIYNFIFQKDRTISIFEKAICDEKLPSAFEIDFVEPRKYHLLSIKCKFFNNEVQEFSLSIKKIGKSESYEQALKKINDPKGSIKKRFLFSKSIKNTDSLNDIFSHIHEEYSSGWFFINPKDTEFNITKNSVSILEKVLKSLDNNVQSVKVIEDDIFAIKLKEETVMIQNGKIIDDSILSSGTKEGIHIGNILYNIIRDKENNSYRAYYVDEKFAYIHTELEKNILSIMLDLLPKESQLFFTTHNSDILDFNVPIHSFTFLKKEDNIEVVNPEKYILKNDRRLKNYIENDMFGTQPSTKFLNKLLEEYQD